MISSQRVGISSLKASRRYVVTYLEAFLARHASGWTDGDFGGSLSLLRDAGTAGYEPTECDIGWLPCAVEVTKTHRADVVRPASSKFASRRSYPWNLRTAAIAHETRILLMLVVIRNCSRILGSCTFCRLHDFVSSGSWEDAEIRAK
ncbi:hypothetical protein [Streptomyces sp. NPDC088246]|uniref:hypothetical protein n=1 Tax=Streptomyces sp. NPDC088246 TaxID=3365842 RepID=UPI003805AC78